MRTEEIQQDLRAAMKARDRRAVAALRMVVAAIRERRAEPGHDGEVSDDEVEALIAREAKRRSEAAETFAAAGRDDLADNERAELAVLRRYLPEQLDDGELGAFVDAAIAETGASAPSDMGRVMSTVMPKVAGRADGRRVNAMVRERLSG